MTSKVLLLIALCIALIAAFGGAFYWQTYTVADPMEKESSAIEVTEKVATVADAAPLPKESPQKTPPAVSTEAKSEGVPSEASGAGTKHTTQQTETPVVVSPDEPPLKLKGIGVAFDDFKFTHEKLQFNRLFMGFGFIIPGSVSSSGSDKVNPQPTYIVPLGTPVRSIVDGVVAAMPTLWSGDVSVHITTDGKMQKWMYEMEHLVNPKVKVGDHVKAGDIVGEVSNFNKGAPPGYGTVEIGLLKGGQTPQHVCPFAYLDDSIKEATFASMRDLFQSWETYVGDESLYTETQIPGCLTLESVEG